MLIYLICILFYFISVQIYYCTRCASSCVSLPLLYTYTFLFSFPFSLVVDKYTPWFYSRDIYLLFASFIFYSCVLFESLWCHLYFYLKTECNIVRSKRINGADY